MSRLTTSKNYCDDCDFGKAKECFFDDKEKFNCKDKQIYEKLREYEDLEEQELLLKLPCKIGDTVYTACAWGIESGVVGSIEIISNRIFVNNPYHAMIAEAHNIFHTREQAEQKLKEMEREDK